MTRIATALLMGCALLMASPNAEARKGEQVIIDAAYVRGRLAGLAGDADLSKYIL